MLIRCVPAAAFGTNCWVLAHGPGSDCLIVDPGFGVADGVRDVLAAEGLRPAAVLLTHGHADHVWSVVPVCASADPPPAVYLHGADAYRLEDPMARVDPQLVAMIAAQFPHEGTWARPAGVVELSGGTDRVEAAGMSVDVRHTPGHTEGSVVFAMSGDPVSLLVSGDVLFAGSVGRTDLPGGDQSAMVASLRAVMTAYSDDTRVLPGHGATTTIGAERRGNPFVRSAMSVAAGVEL